jgi:hypothetical protein
MSVLPENNTEGAGVDCDHDTEIEHEADPMNLSNSISVAHRLTCTLCRTSAVVIEHQAVAP